jgi:hypothetical protein
LPFFKLCLWALFSLCPSPILFWSYILRLFLFVLVGFVGWICRDFFPQLGIVFFQALHQFVKSRLIVVLFFCLGTDSKGVHVKILFFQYISLDGDSCFLHDFLEQDHQILQAEIFDQGHIRQHFQAYSFHLWLGRVVVLGVSFVHCPQIKLVGDYDLFYMFGHLVKAEACEIGAELLREHAAKCLLDLWLSIEAQHFFEPFQVDDGIIFTDLFQLSFLFHLLAFAGLSCHFPPRHCDLLGKRYLQSA